MKRSSQLKKIPPRSSKSTYNGLSESANNIIPTWIQDASYLKVKSLRECDITYWDLFCEYCWAWKDCLIKWDKTLKNTCCYYKEELG